MLQVLTNDVSCTIVDYVATVNQSAFIDKTLLIKSIIGAKERQIIITAPHRSGRSTNIAMLQQFFEISDGYEQSSRGPDAPANRTSNYKFFLKNRLAITRDKRIMRDYLGRFPVLRVDFKCEHKIRNSDDSVICFREVIHEAFFKHRYLRQSEKLATKEKKYVKKWCDNFGAYEEFFGQDVTNSLYKLARLLYKHFGETESIVLIDNFDFPIVNSMSELKNGEEYRRVLRYNMGIISKLLSADYMYVRKSIVIGTSYVATAALYKMERARCIRYLDSDNFVQYFGLDKSEVAILFANPVFNLDKTAVGLASDFYGGFATQAGHVMHNLHSVLKFLQFGKVECYCLQSRFVRNIGNLFKINLLRSRVEDLVRGKHLCIPMYENVTAEDLIYLNKAASNLKYEGYFNVDIFFYFLFEQGLLTYVPYPRETSTSNCTVLGLPNREVKTRLALKLKDYYDSTYYFDTPRLRKCASFLLKVSPKTYKNVAHNRMAVFWFYKSIDDLIGNYYKRRRKITFDIVQKLIFSFIFEFCSKDKSDFFVNYRENEGFSDYRIIKGELEYRIGFTSEHNSSSVLQRMEEGERDVRNSVLIGLCVNDQFHPSVSCLTNSRDVSHSVHMPDT